MKKRALKKKTLKKALLMLGLTTTLIGISGCGAEKSSVSENTEKPAVAFAIANTANAKAMDLSAPIIQDTMLNCAENYGYSVIVRVDGEPELVSAESLNIDEQYKVASKERLMRDARNKASNLLNVLGNVSAVNPEVDFLEGLRCAAASLHSLDDTYTSRTIICCGTGLGTTGYMNFTNNLLTAQPDVLVDMLKEREALPDLTDITVYWFGMAQVAAPQDKLTPKQAKNLEGIWKAVVEASGGEFVSNDFIGVSQELEEKGTLPEVTVIEIPEEQPIIFEPEALEDKKDDTAFEKPVMLGEKQVEFIGDQAEYLDPDAALKTLKPIADYLSANQNVNLLLIGATAGDENSKEALLLSQKRAETVRDSLIGLGINEKRITAIGMGSNDPWHVKGAGYEGPVASGNRKVVLLDASTKLAKNLLKKSKSNG